MLLEKEKHNFGLLVSSIETAQLTLVGVGQKWTETGKESHKLHTHREVVK